MADNDWHLVDGEARNAALPATFQIPPSWMHEAVPPGTFVKIAAEWDELLGRPCLCERFWVEVLRREEDTYYGVVANDLVCGWPFDHGALLAFGPRHVLDFDFPRAEAAKASEERECPN